MIQEAVTFFPREIMSHQYKAQQKWGFWVAFFPCLAVYLRTAKYIMSINAHKLTSRRWVGTSNPKQIPDAFSGLNPILALPGLLVCLFSWWRHISLAIFGKVLKVLHEHCGKSSNEHRDFNSHTCASNMFSRYAQWMLLRRLIRSRCFC